MKDTKDKNSTETTQESSAPEKKKKSLEEVLKNAAKSKTIKKIPPAAAPWFWSDKAQSGY